LPSPSGGSQAGIPGSSQGSSTSSPGGSQPGFPAPSGGQPGGQDSATAGGSAGDSASGSNDPFGEEGRGGTDDPFAEGGSSNDPFAEGSGSGGEGDGSDDPFGDGDGDGSNGDGTQAGSSEQSGAFERALEEFDELMGQEQEAIARTGVGSAADRVFQGAAAGNTDDVFGLPEEGGGVGASGGSEPGTAPPIPGGGNAEPTINVEGCEDPDKVARQLCEAATDEKDPFLRAALWNEYNEYRKILARQ
jgi:hypothetical protein